MYCATPWADVDDNSNCIWRYSVVRRIARFASYLALIVVPLQQTDKQERMLE
jgi:hypothetical protein